MTETGACLLQHLVASFSIGHNVSTLAVLGPVKYGVLVSPQKQRSKQFGVKLSLRLIALNLMLVVTDTNYT